MECESKNTFEKNIPVSAKEIQAFSHFTTGEQEKYFD